MAKKICCGFYPTPRAIWIAFGPDLKGFRTDAALRKILNAESEETRKGEFTTLYEQKLDESACKSGEFSSIKIPGNELKLIDKNKKKIEEFVERVVLQDHINDRYGNMAEFSTWKADEILETAVDKVLGIADALKRIEACMIHILEIPVSRTAVFIRDAFREYPHAAAFILTNLKAVTIDDTEYVPGKTGVSLKWIVAFIHGVWHTSSYIDTDGDVSGIQEKSITKPGEAAKMLQQLVTRMAKSPATKSTRSLPITSVVNTVAVNDRSKSGSEHTLSLPTTPVKDTGAVADMTKNPVRRPDAATKTYEYSTAKSTDGKDGMSNNESDKKNVLETRIPNTADAHTITDVADIEARHMEYTATTAHAHEMAPTELDGSPDMSKRSRTISLNHMDVKSFNRPSTRTNSISSST